MPNPCTNRRTSSACGLGNTEVLPLAFDMRIGQSL
jgi:hypothetical protein